MYVELCNVFAVSSTLIPTSIVDGIFQDLDVKSLLLEAYVKGQQELLYVVPFVAKVLESSVRSVVSVFVQSYSSSGKILQEVISFCHKMNTD